jgi:hypothetical protein
MGHPRFVVVQADGGVTNVPRGLKPSARAGSYRSAGSAAPPKIEGAFGTTEVVPFPGVALPESSEGWSCGIPSFAECARPSDSAQAGFGVRFVPSLRDSVPFLAAYPGLTSWAIICRPSGAHVFAASASLPS